MIETLFEPLDYKMCFICDVAIRYCEWRWIFLSDIVLFISNGMDAILPAPRHGAVNITQSLAFEDKCFCHSKKGTKTQQPYCYIYRNWTDDDTTQQLQHDEQLLVTSSLWRQEGSGVWLELIYACNTRVILGVNWIILNINMSSHITLKLSRARNLTAIHSSHTHMWSFQINSM